MRFLILLKPWAWSWSLILQVDHHQWEDFIRCPPFGSDQPKSILNQARTFTKSIGKIQEIVFTQDLTCGLVLQALTYLYIYLNTIEMKKKWKRRRRNGENRREKERRKRVRRREGEREYRERNERKERELWEIWEIKMRERLVGNLLYVAK